MANLSANLFAAWSDGDDSEPDPTTLPGLLSISESRLDESVESFRTLMDHFESVHRRVMESQNNLKGMLAKAGELPTEVAEAGQENVEAFEDLITLLEDLQALEPEDEADAYWELLGAFEDSSENIRAANLRLAEATKSA